MRGGWSTLTTGWEGGTIYCVMGDYHNIIIGLLLVLYHFFFVEGYMGLRHGDADAFHIPFLLTFWLLFFSLRYFRSLNLLTVDIYI